LGLINQSEGSDGLDYTNCPVFLAAVNSFRINASAKATKCKRARQ